MKQYISAIREYSQKNYLKMTREAKGILKYPFIVPGSEGYNDCLWDSVASG